jgi:hypothetical protein
MALAAEHWAGTKTYRRHEPFKPDLSRYKAYNDAGAFLLITAREFDKLAGYFGLYIVPSMHSQLLTATEDTWFIAPHYRTGRNAVRMYQFVERECRHRGVHEILFSCEVDNPSGIHGLLKMLGYKAVITQYSKLLDAPSLGSDTATAPAQTPDVESADVRTITASGS